MPAADMVSHLLWPPAQPVGELCCITIVRDDEYLQAWLEHYTLHFRDVDFIVVDHASTNPVSDLVKRKYPDTRINVITWPAVPFDSAQHSTAASALAGIAVQCYRTVIVSDGDEIVVPLYPGKKPLAELLAEESGPFIAPIGIEVVHHIGSEDDLDFARPVLDQRNHVAFSSAGTKPAIWKGDVACLTPGNHWMSKPYRFSETLGLAHLRFADRGTFWRRQQLRNNCEVSEFHAANSFGVHWQRKAKDDRFEAIRKMQTFPDRDRELADFMVKLRESHEARKGKRHDIKLRSKFTQYDPVVTASV